MSKSHPRVFPWLLALLAAPALFAQEPMAISGPELEVNLYSDRPVVSSYLHKPTGSRFEGAGRDGVLALNGRAVPWSEWKIATQRQPGAVVYAMSLPTEGVSFDYAFAVEGNALEIELRNIRDSGGKLKMIEWKGLPLLLNSDPAYKYWRVITSTPDPGGKMWMGEASGEIGTSAPEGAAVPVIYGTQYRSDRLCVFAHSNYPLFPFTHQVLEGKRYAVSVNTYQYRVRQRTMPPLRVQVVFLGDLNGDGVADVSDYRLWLNRRLPAPDPMYRTSMFYKILIEENTAGILTNFGQAGDIIRAIHNVTDGLSQIVYLVNWHDDVQNGGPPYTGPMRPKINSRAGGDSALRDLVKTAEANNALLSYHVIVDDGPLKDRAGWEKLMCEHGVSHTLDAETGHVYEALESMMGVIPVEKTIHIDNVRITNCGKVTDPDGIRPLEELEAGFKPVVDWLRAKGITMTTEGVNGIPLDPTYLFAGLWHYDPPIGAFQLFHGKLFGGGYGDHYGPPVLLDLALGSSIHQDFTYRAWKNPLLNGIERDASGVRPEWVTVSFERDWDEMVRRIYLGSLLYQFYLEREMTKFDGDRDGFTARYGKDVQVKYRRPDTLRVTWGDVVVADGGDRFIPRGNAIYAYSEHGSERTWMLPPAFRGKLVQVFTLSKNGHGPAPEFRLERDRVWLKLAPKTPVKLILNNLDQR